MRPIQIKLPRKKTKRCDTLEQAFVEVVLGRPSANCKYLGICKIKLIYANRLPKDVAHSCSSSSSLIALASLKEGAYFELTFERNAIPDNIFDFHFQSGVFKVGEEYFANLELSNSPIFISAGEYKIKFSETLLTIRFEID